MRITDELRQYARAVWTEEDYGRVVHIPNGKLLAIADCIDKRHDKECDKAYSKGVCDGIDADKNEMGYIKLPVDADGVPIHMGDNIEIISGETGTVVAIELCEGGWNVSMLPTGWDVPTLFDAKSVRHVKPDSWERIIKDARESSGFRTIGGELPKYTDAELVERCRRLADA